MGHFQEEVENIISATAAPIEWEKVAASDAAEQDRFVSAFGDVVADNVKNNKDEAKSIAMDAAKTKISQMNISSGKSTADKELQKYIDDKNKIIEATEARARVAIMEGKYINDLGQDNVYPANIIKKEAGLMSTNEYGQEINVTSEFDPEIEAMVNADLGEIEGTKVDSVEPMSTDIEVTKGEPVETDDIDINAALDDIDNMLNDSDEDVSEQDETVESSLENAGVDPETAKNIRDQIDQAVKTAVEAVENAVHDTENDEVDEEFERAIDAYEDSDEYTDMGMYESLCVTFNIENGKELLESCNYCIPDAVLAMAEQVRQARGK